MDRAMVFAEGTADLMQRLSRLPTAPDLGLLRRRKTMPSTWSHEHHLQKQMISIRWCCIHRLSSQDFAGTCLRSRLSDTLDLPSSTGASAPLNQVVIDG